MSSRKSFNESASEGSEPDRNESEGSDSEERLKSKRTDEISHQATSSKRNDVDQEIVQSKLYEYFYLKRNFFNF